VTTPPLDLAGCAAEPIRVPGAIQPHGWLLVQEVASGRLVAYSDNCEQLTDVASGPAQTAALQAIADDLRLQSPTGLSDGPPVSIGVTVVGNRSLDATRATAGSLALLELEPASPQSGTQAPMYSLARRFVPMLQKAMSVPELAGLAAAEMKQLTGFGRCLVYSFDSEGHGNVLAERADEGYDSYVGHSFPASDIPSQARDLYLANHIRLIPDANYRPSPLHFVDPAWGPAALDLSFAQLRSVSPIHLEYMRNMGTLASMSVSIVVRGRLWGLISCHDRAPRGLGLEARFACEHLGRLLSLQIEAKEDNAEVEMRHDLSRLTMQIVSRLGESDATLQGIVDASSLLLRMAQASGAAVVFDEQCWHVGVTPSDEHILATAEWIFSLGAEIYESDSLRASGAPFVDDLENTAGVLAISLSQVHRHLVIWFRPELVRSVRWAGEASKEVDNRGRLHPRQSFKSWEESVRGHSAPWLESEIAAVAELRQSLIGIVLQRAQERAAAAGRLGRVTLAKELAEQANSAKTHFLAVLSHELRTPLASISNAAELIARNAVLPEKLANLVPMIKRNVAIEVRLIDDLLDLSAVSTGKLNLSVEPVDMDALVAQVAEMLRHDVVAKDLQLAIEPSRWTGSVPADPVRMQQVLSNILRNAIKFTPRGGRIRVVNQAFGDHFVVAFIDSGVGIEADALSRIFLPYEQASVDTYQRFGGLGLGLAIAMGIVESHSGRLEVASEGRDRGATFTLRLPLAAMIEKPATSD
jgi:chemotaxis family two-component system sensor kinase Cph1